MSFDCMMVYQWIYEVSTILKQSFHQFLLFPGGVRGNHRRFPAGCLAILIRVGLDDEGLAAVHPG